MLKKKTIKTDAKTKKTTSTAAKKTKLSRTKINPLMRDEIFEALFNNAGVGIVILNAKENVIGINTAIKKLLGYSDAEFSKISIKDFTHPHDYKIDQKLFKELVTGKRNSYQIEKRYLTKDGKIKYGRLTISRANKIYGADSIFVALIEDISDQKQITDKLSFEQNLFYTLLDNIPDSIYFKDVNSRFIKANKGLAKKHGFKSSDLLIGKSDTDMYGPGHATEAYADEQQIIKTGIPIIGKEEREDWTDGKITWSSTTKMPLYAADGKIIGTFGISRDITERRLNEERVIESEQLYRSIFESSADGIFLTSENIIIDCNQAVLDIFKCQRDYVIGHSPSELSPEIQPDGHDSSSSSEEKIKLAFNGSPQSFYWQHKRFDNALVDCEISLKSIIIKGKKLIQATMHDITARKKSEQIQEILFEISEAAYTTTDMFTLYKRIHEIIGKLMPTKNIYIALYDEKNEMISFPYFVDEYDPQMQPKKLGNGLTEYVLRKGEALLVNAEKDLELRRSGEVELIGAPQAIWLGVPLKLANKTIGVIVVQDYENEKAYGEEEMQILNFVSEQVAQVIERKRNAEAVRKYAEELKQSNATKDKFFSIIAHDLKNPFITILGFSDLILSEFSDLNEDEKIYYITEMKKSAEISHSLLQNLLQWSRSQTGRIEFNPQKLNLRNIVHTNLELLCKSAEKKHIQINHNIPDELNLFADEDMLNTIIRNLLTNALKFTDKNGIIDISATTLQNGFAEIIVTDNGVGMDKLTQENLFKLDATHSTTGTENETGTGLGLILCKEFVEKNGGNIRVESELGVGSKFYFTLPKA